METVVWIHSDDRDMRVLWIGLIDCQHWWITWGHLTETGKE